MNSMQLQKLSPRWRAILQALFVTFLWSTSWIFIKFGFQDIPALPFAGLRYVLAFLSLLPFARRSGQTPRLRQLSRRDWVRLILLGLLYYAVTQGALYLSLFYLPAVTNSLWLSFTPIIVAFLGISTLGEPPAVLQWGGTALYLLSVLLYFYPIDLPGRQLLGLLIALTGVLANDLSAILGRYVNRSQNLSPTTITVASMGVGAPVLLASGVLMQGMPRLTLTHWAIILWLALVNSALAYTLWNHTLRVLSAIESSIINSTSLSQIAVLAWLFLDEDISGRQLVAIVLAALGTLAVQWRRRGPAPEL